MRVIQTIASTRYDFGGTSRSVPALCNALVDLGVDNELITSMPSAGIGACNLPNNRQRVHLIPEQGLPSQFIVGSHFSQCLKQQCTANSIVHDHAIWLPNNRAVARFCNSRGLTRIVSPRGMLSNWAMNNSKWKKRVAWWLFQKWDLQTATAFHATCDQEAEEIREHGLKQPIVVVPNGVDIPTSLPSKTNNTSKQFLFMSRLHPKKGLENLLNAWVKSDAAEHGWSLKIVGPDENGYRKKLESLTLRLNTKDSVFFCDAVNDSAKWQTLVNADYFVLPSFSENFGIVIAEALAAGVPTIASVHTPWQDIEIHRCGWWINNDVEALSATILRAIRVSDEERFKMGQRASDWIRRAYSWESAALKLNAFYNTLPPNTAHKTIKHL